MKKVLAILFAVSLCISSLYTVAFAEEEMSNEMIPVCVSVPEGWDAPCCWAWADDGTNAFEAWPGEQLEPLDDGWYYTYVPRFVQNIIVNASEACALPGFVDSKNEEKTERNAGYLVVSQSGGGMLRQGTRKGIRRTPANRGMRAHWVVKGLDISEDVCHGMCP